ncbi:MAG: hypothetical protein RBU23_11580 [Candidatus Auribacterota bacterium]|jgi:hypothetical protein|nr:hypothetical protein [Candidatus Auribacterota bacterium]
MDNKKQFRLDIKDILKKVKNKVEDNVNGISISIPFLSFSVSIDNTEKDVARELIIRLEDKRVLSGIECCDNCIQNSIA